MAGQLDPYPPNARALTHLNVNLERPAILTPFTEFAAAIIGEFGSSPDALVDVLTGVIAPLGRLPFEIPRSMAAVLASKSDLANDTVDPVFPAGFGLSITE